jgi:replication factor C subunit 2/4
MNYGMLDYFVSFDCKILTFLLFIYRNLGYSAHDIISTMFRVTKSIPTLSEHSKLEFIREIGFTHMRILDGVQSLLQLSGCVAKLCRINMKPDLFEPKV